MINLRRVGSGRKVLLVLVLVCLVASFLYLLLIRSRNVGQCQFVTSRDTVVFGKDGKAHSYDRSSPFIFIGGFPRSGTTLIRAMLDAHSDIRCGEETRMLPRILQLITQWKKSPKESKRLQEAGLTDQIIADAVAAFILEIVVKHGEPAPRVCNKDPFTLKYGVYLLNLFPQSKFIFMIRDGRAVVHSMISRKVTVTGFDLTNYKQCLTKWSSSMNAMLKECDELGADRCLKVKYEELVLHPRTQMERILQYLGLPWMENVLHHDQFINKPGGVSLSIVERSSDQVVKPVNVQALSKWVGEIPDDVVRDMDSIAPMLTTLGYDPKANPPNYEAPDPEVITNTYDVIKNHDKWTRTVEDALRKSKYL